MEWIAIAIIVGGGSMAIAIKSAAEGIRAELSTIADELRSVEAHFHHTDEREIGGDHWPDPTITDSLSGINQNLASLQGTLAQLKDVLNREGA
jgi:hypothetical protein